MLLDMHLAQRLAIKQKEGRPGKAGKDMGKAIIEMVNLMYQNQTAKQFLKSLIKVLELELKKRVT